MGEKTAITWTDHTPRIDPQTYARQRVNLEVGAGKMPHPNSIPCVDCGHVHVAGERRHEYDHHRGYDDDHVLDVQAVCTLCHGARGTKAKQTHCVRGHLFDEANTLRIRGGRGRRCRACCNQRHKRRSADRKATRMESSGGR